MPVQDALNAAVDYCLEHHILYETLKEHRSEVLGMRLEEFEARTGRPGISGSVVSRA